MSSKWFCPKHGILGDNFTRISFKLNGPPTGYEDREFCIFCIIDWMEANISKVTKVNSGD